MNTKTTSDSTNYYKFKWSSMRNRRIFYFPIISIMLIATYIFIYIEIKESIQIKPFSNKYYIFSTIPFVFLACHIVLFFINFSSLGSKNLLHNENQFKRFCEWSVFSIAIALSLLVVFPSIIESRKSSLPSIIFFIIVANNSSKILHDLGIPLLLLQYLFLIISILWMIKLFQISTNEYISITSMSLLTIQVVINVALIILWSFTAEYETKRLFYNQKSSKLLDLENFREDISLSLSYLNAQIGNGMISQKNSATNTTFYLSRLFSQSIYASLNYANHQETNVLSIGYLLNKKKSFQFTKICSSLFSIFESVEKKPLPLFFANSNVVLTANQRIIELILFCLIHDSIKKNYICAVECKLIDNIWCIVLLLTKLKVFENVIKDPVISKNIPKILKLAMKNSMLNLAPNAVTSMERIAELIAIRHFKIEIETTDLENNLDIQTRRLVLKLPNIDCSHDIDIVHKDNEEIMNNHSSWLFIGNQDSNYILNFDLFKKKFLALRIPFEEINLYYLKKLKCRYPAIIVFESLLINEKDKKKNVNLKKDDYDFAAEISKLSMCILIITEASHPVNSIMLQNKYGLKNVPFCISNKSSVVHLYDMVFKIINTRKIHKTDSEIFEDLQEASNQKEQVLKNESIDQNYEDPLIMIWHNIFEKMEKIGELHLSKFNNSNFDDFKSIILKCKDRIKLFKKEFDVAELDNIFDKYHYIRKISKSNSIINFLEENSTSNFVSSAQVNEEYLEKKDEMFSQKLSLFAHLPLSKKRSKVVIDTFYPTIASLRKSIENFDLIGIKNLAIEYSIISGKYRFSKLIYSYETLEIMIEAVNSYLINLIDEDEDEQVYEDNSFTKTTPLPIKTTSFSITDSTDSTYFTNSLLGNAINSSILIKEQNSFIKDDVKNNMEKSLKISVVDIINNMIDATETSIWDYVSEYVE